MTENDFVVKLDLAVKIVLVGVALVTVMSIAVWILIIQGA